jgi:hypothetical protein
VGKNNKIVGMLDSDASPEMINDMFKASEASFYDLNLRKHQKQYIMQNGVLSVELKDLYSFGEAGEPEFTITEVSNDAGMSFSISNGFLIFTDAQLSGHSEFIVKAQVKNAEAWVNTQFTVFNYNDPVVEDFEYLTIGDSNYAWTPGGDKGWNTDKSDSFSRNYSIRSGEIGHEMSSETSLKINLNSEGAVTFAYKTNTEISYFEGEYSGDFLNFYINGTNMSKLEPRELWGGENDWRIVTFQLPAGTHDLKFQYLRNDWGTNDTDAVWIDFLLYGVSSPKQTPGLSIKSEPELNVHPNPFNPSTNISFTLEKTQKIKLSLYDSKGSVIQQFADGERNKGFHSFRFSAERLSTGIYYAVLETDNHRSAKKIMLIK